MCRHSGRLAEIRVRPSSAGTACGGAPEHVSAIERGELRSPVLTQRQQAVAVFAREVQTNVRATDASLAEVRRHFTDRQVIELIFCIGQYMLNSRIAENTGVTLDDDKRFAKPGQPIPELPMF